MRVLKFSEYISEKVLSNNIEGSLITSDMISDLLSKGKCYIKADVIKNQHDTNLLDDIYKKPENIKDDVWMDVVDLSDDFVTIEYNSDLFDVELKDIKKIKGEKVVD